MEEFINGSQYFKSIALEQMRRIDMFTQVGIFFTHRPEKTLYYTLIGKNSEIEIMGKSGTNFIVCHGWLNDDRQTVRFCREESGLGIDFCAIAPFSLVQDMSAVQAYTAIF